MSTATQPIGVIAKLLDRSERRVQQLSREGVIPKAEHGQYDLIGSVRGYVRYLCDQAVKAQAASGGGSPARFSRPAPSPSLPPDCRSQARRHSGSPSLGSAS